MLGGAPVDQFSIFKDRVDQFLVITRTLTTDDTQLLLAEHNVQQ